MITDLQSADSIEGSDDIIVLDDENGLQSRHSQHISLRRIDEMMHYIIAEAQGHPLSSNSSPFLAPPWAKDQDRGQILSWAAGLQSKPFHLMCVIVNTWQILFVHCAVCLVSIRSHAHVVK